MNEIIQKVTILAFIGSLGFLGVKTIAEKPKDYSELEYRNLAQRPILSKDNLVSGEFAEEFETYFQDQFAYRIPLSQSFYKLQAGLGRALVGDVLIGEKEWISQVPMLASDRQIEHSVNQLNRMQQLANEMGIPLYLSLNPHKDLTINHLYPYHPSYTKKEQEKEIVLTQIDKGINIIDNATYFQKHFSPLERESFYYKTDHHWNYKGAYENYKYLIARLSELHPDISAPLSESQLQLHCADRENVFFIGSTNRAILNSFNEKGDSVCAYGLVEGDKQIDVTVTNYMGDDIKGYSNVFHTGLADSEQTYNGLFVEDYPEIIIRAKEAPNDKRVLVIRDSYTNAMLPYLGVHFAEMRVLDMRYFRTQSVKSYIEEHDINLIILSHNDGLLTGDTISYGLSKIKVENE